MSKKTTKARLNKLRAKIKNLKKEKSQLAKFKTTTDGKTKYFKKQSTRAHDKIGMLDNKIIQLGIKLKNL